MFSLVFKKKGGKKTTCGLSDWKCFLSFFSLPSLRSVWGFFALLFTYPFLYKTNASPYQFYLPKHASHFTTVYRKFLKYKTVNNFYLKLIVNVFLCPTTTIELSNTSAKTSVRLYILSAKWVIMSYGLWRNKKVWTRSLCIWTTSYRVQTLHFCQHKTDFPRRMMAVYFSMKVTGEMISYRFPSFDLIDGTSCHHCPLPLHSRFPGNCQEKKKRTCLLQDPSHLSQLSITGA